MVVFGKKRLYLSRVVVFEYNWLYSGKNGCIRAKVVVFEQNCCIQAKVLLFRQSDCIRAKVVVFNQNCCIRAKLVIRLKLL